MKHQLATALAALAFTGLALLVPDRAAALTGALLAGATGVASIFAMGWAARSAGRPTQQALLVFVIFFLLRLALVGAATAVVVRAGWDVVAFVASFFVPYFVLSALEAAYLHSLRRTVTTA